VSLALHDVVPHTITQSLHLRVKVSESHLAKRLLQQYRHQTDSVAAPRDFRSSGQSRSSVEAPPLPTLTHSGLDRPSNQLTQICRDRRGLSRSRASFDMAEDEYTSRLPYARCAPRDSKRIS